MYVYVLYNMCTVFRFLRFVCMSQTEQSSETLSARRRCRARRGVRTAGPDPDDVRGGGAFTEFFLLLFRAHALLRLLASYTVHLRSTHTHTNVFL